MSILAFDFETIPDFAGLRLMLPEEDRGLGHDALLKRAQHHGLCKAGTDFLPHDLHRIVAIACVFRGEDQIHIRALGQPEDDEATLIQLFLRTIDKHVPQLVSWNGSGFDLPVLNYRALIHGAVGARFWEQGERDPKFKWDNYLNRYHHRHLDLMDVLALQQPRAYAALDRLAKLCGLPGKMGMDGSQVFQAYQAGQIEEIRQYCQTDALNTYLLYVRHQLLSGAISSQQYCEEIELVRSTLEQLADPHWPAYLTAWREIQGAA